MGFSLGKVTNMALLNYEFDRQLELERADAYAEGFLRGYKKGFEKEMRKQMVFNMYEEGYSVDLIADIVVELTKEEIEDAIQKNICYDGNIDCDGIEGTRQYRILWQLR